jgi:hypothetical protein
MTTTKYYDYLASTLPMIIMTALTDDDDDDAFCAFFSAFLV